MPDEKEEKKIDYTTKYKDKPHEELIRIKHDLIRKNDELEREISAIEMMIRAGDEEIVESKTSSMKKVSKEVKESKGPMEIADIKKIARRNYKHMCEEYNGIKDKGENKILKECREVKKKWRVMMETLHDMMKKDKLSKEDEAYVEECRGEV